MDLKEITERNYKATVKRGIITDRTEFIDFIDKLEEEWIEVRESVELVSISKRPWTVKFDEKELSDVIIVCLSIAKHYGIDIQKALEEKTLYNEQRKD